MKTFIPKQGQIDKKWYIVDAEGQIMGRLAANIARVLTGKHKPGYTPFLDTGDFVVVINAGKIAVTGKKLAHNMYRYHTGYPGGLKETEMRHMYADKPERLFHVVMRGMMPKTKLGRQMLSKLKIYAGPNHCHQAQKPAELKFQ